MTYYAIIDNHTGFLWGIVTAKTPEDACCRIDEHIAPDAKRRYVPIFAHGLAANDTAYHVFELDHSTYDSLWDADGQDEKELEIIHDYGKTRNEHWRNWREWQLQQMK